MGQHAVNEREYKWLDKIVHLDRHTLVFCALQCLHTNIRLTEAFVKDLFGRTIKSALREDQGLEQGVAVRLRVLAFRREWGL
jgi:hypothetical protein